MVVEKTDLLKMDPTYYKAKKEPQLVDLEPYYFLSVAGQSAPDDRKFEAAIEMLYAVAYGIKFIAKSEDMDFTVPKLEGYWWADGEVNSQEEFAKVPREQWRWKIAIRMPDFVEESMYFRSMQVVKTKKPQMIEIEKVKFELISEGLSAQVLHLGSYENEAETITKLHSYIDSHQLKVNGHHHEIYLSDPRRTPVEKLKTILRYAVV